MDNTIRSNPWIACMAMLAVLQVGCGNTSAPQANSDPKADASIPPSGSPAVGNRSTSDDLASAKPDVTLSADKAFRDLADQMAFSSKYNNKVVDITGPLTMYDYDPANDTGTFVLGPGLNKFACVEAHPMAKAMPGQTVTLRARCDILNGIGEMLIVKVEGPTPPEVSAAQLLREYAADENGTATKYRGKYIIVSGAIKQVDEYRVCIDLGSKDSKSIVRCGLGVNSFAAAKRNKWVAEGQEVRILGDWTSGDPHLNNAAILPPAK